MKPEPTYFDKDTTKLRQELCQVLDKVAHPRPASCRLGKLCPYVVGSVGPLAGSELSLGFVPERDTYPFPFELLRRRIPGRSPQWLPHDLYLLFIEYLAILPRKIDPVSEESLRELAEPFLEEVDMEREIGRFVVGVPAVVVDEGVSVDDADPDLGSELDLRLRLAAYYGTEMRLVDADDPVPAGMCAEPEHLLLLVVHVDDRLDGTFLRAVEVAVDLVIHTYKVEQGEYVAVEQREHAGDAVLDQALPLELALDRVEVYGTDAGALNRDGLAYALVTAYLVDHAVDVSASVLDEVYVGRVSHFCIRTCSIRLEVGRQCLGCQLTGSGIVSVVPVIAFTLSGFFRGLLREFERQRVDVLYRDALAYGHEQGGVEDWPVRVFGQAAQILHVGILPDGLDGFPVGEVEPVLYYQRPYYGAPRYVGGSEFRIAEPLHVEGLQLSPGKSVAHKHPPVALRQELERTLHLFEG